MTELRECPFCGGKAEIKTYLDDNEFNIWGGSVACTRCDISYDVGICSQDTIESELEHLWNDRYEPTCTMKHEDREPPLHLGKWTCSRCGGWWMLPPYDLSAVHYCPGCGAKVVDE